MTINQIKPHQGYLGPEPLTPTYDVMVIDQHAYRIHRVTVHEFTLGDVDDVEIYAAQPIREWQQTEKGRWVMDKAIESPSWYRNNDLSTWSQRFIITAKLKDRDYTFYQLKWGNGR